MIRCWVKQAALEQAEVELDADESAHLLKVLRARPGCEVQLLDGCGGTARGRLMDRPGPAVVACSSREQHTPPPARLTLFQALPKRGKLELIVQKATELGAWSVVPVQLRHCVVRWRPEQVTDRTTRLQRVAREAAKQCGSPWLTRVEPLQRLDDMLEALGTFDLVLWAALEPGARTLDEVLAEQPIRKELKIACLVGPEGDFSEEESAALRAAPVCPVTLGSRVLRTETAAVTLLAILGNRLGI